MCILEFGVGELGEVAMDWLMKSRWAKQDLGVIESREW